MWRTIDRYLISIVVSCIIFFLSTNTNGSAIPVPHFYGADKVCHLLMYVVLAFCLTVENGIVRMRYKFLLVFVVPALYGGLLELLQEYYFPPRTGDWYDWLADVVGVAIGCCIGLSMKSVAVVKKIFRR